MNNKPIFKNRPNELIVTADGRKLYHSRSVAVVGIISACLPEGIFYVIEKRGTAPGLDKQGLWCLPCGYLDWDESGTDAMCREIWEEVGLDVKSLCSTDFSNLQPFFVKTNPDENRQNVTLRYHISLPVAETLKPNNDCEPNEVADAKWIRSDHINDYQFAFNHDSILREFDQKYIRAGSGGY